MERTRSLMMAVLLAMSCVRQAGSDVMIDVVESRGTSFDVRIINQSSVAILLISPVWPTLEIDENRCTVRLSTKVVEWVRPYDFTPQLVELRAGEARTFSVDLRKQLPATCREWHPEIEYAYLPAREARAAERQARTRMVFRGYVLRHQQIVRK